LVREFQWGILTSASGFATDTHIYLSKNEIEQFVFRSLLLPMTLSL